MLRRRCGTLLSGISLMLRPATHTEPFSGRSWRFIIRNSVLLPEPDGPTRNTNSRLGDVEAGVAKRDDLGRVALGDVLESDHRWFSTSCCNRHAARSS